jgi:hypothetical protein
MDPWLEGELWMSFHGPLVTEIAAQLAPRLRPRYIALTQKRFVPDPEEGIAIAVGTLLPDVGVASAWPSGAAGTVAAEIAAPVVLETAMPVAVPHQSIEIRDVAERRLVTAIEVLSPTNKRGEGRGEYLSKRAALLHSTAHLMEIDLLRRGERLPMTQPLPPAAYYVLLSRAEERPRTGVWPIQLADRLPPVPVPLLPGDADVTLDLQDAFNSAYDRLAFDLAANYSQPPDVALPASEAAWADGRLRSAGVRS